MPSKSKKPTQMYLVCHERSTSCYFDSLDELGEAIKVGYFKHLKPGDEFTVFVERYDPKMFRQAGDWEGIE